MGDVSTPPPVSPAPVSTLSPAASTNQVDAGDGGMSYLEDQSTNQLVCEQVLDTKGTDQSIDPSAGAVSVASSSYQSIDPYTGDQSVSSYANQSIDPSAGGMSIDPYNGGPSANPYTCQPSDDPYFTGQSIAPTSDSQNVSSSPDGQLFGSDQNMSINAAGPGVAMAGVTVPPWFDISDRVADSLRENATDAYVEDWAESFDSGIYSENSIASLERGVSIDQFEEAADLQELRATDPGATFADLVDESEVMMESTGSHVPSIYTDPVGAEGLSNVYGVNEDVHFGGDHAGNYQNDPGDFADTNPQVDPEMEAEFGEGANMQQYPETRLGQSGFDEGVGEWSETAAKSPEDLLIESEEAMEAETAVVEGSEFVETGAIVIEAGETFEAADLLFLLLLL
jgi:hypothetical protein